MGGGLGLFNFCPNSLLCPPLPMGAVLFVVFGQFEDTHGTRPGKKLIKNPSILPIGIGHYSKTSL